MKILALKNPALSASALGLVLAGCGASQALPDLSRGIGQNVTRPPATIHNQKSGDVATTNKDLVYLSYGSCGSHITGCYSEVAVYTFPGGQPIGTWNAAGYALGECADEDGNVFVTYILGSIGEILKFAHGGTSPVATLSDPTGLPVACSVDPNSGDLAVVNPNNAGTLLIYSNASGIPTTYSYPGVTFYSVSYDSKRNVFVDGLTGPHSSQFVLAKLPKGGRSFENITLNKQVGGAGGLDWDGQYLTIGQSTWYKNEMDLIHRFEIRGTSGRFEGATQPKRLLRGIDQYSIVGKQIFIAYSWKPCRAICGDEGTVGIWSYPSGRVIRKHFTPYSSPSTGMALSLAQTHR